MAVVSKNLRIDKGTDFSADLVVKTSTGSTRDLSGYTAVAKLRKSPKSSTAYSFTTSISGGTITLTMSDVVTATLPSGINTYDVVITSTSSPYLKEKVYEGTITVYDTTSV